MTDYPLVNSKLISVKLGIDHKNFFATRKAKGFPDPLISVGETELWLEADIDDWNATRTKKPNSGRWRKNDGTQV
jgi:predicted DNA-binding transcriptional regulator AlpA